MVGWAAAALFALVSLAARSVTAAQLPQPRFGPHPPWVEPPPSAEPPSADSAIRGQRVLLMDRQVRLEPAGPATYYHLETEITDASGMESASQVVLEFDPSFQELELHSIVVRRDGISNDRLDRAAIKVVQRESNLESQVFDGRLSAVLFLSDLRVHDVVSTEYTLREHDPTLGGRYADLFALAAATPIERMRVRLVVPKTHPLTVVVRQGDSERLDLAPGQRDLGDAWEYLWDLRHTPPGNAEPAIPLGFLRVPMAVVSELGSWRDVSRWGARLFRSNDAPPELRRWVDQQQRQSAVVEDFILDTIRFVQDEVRYVAVELGDARLRPSAPAEVFARRYGDCKGKAALLVKLLHLGGVQARPALVSTWLGRGLDGLPPTPIPFDHVIVEVTEAGSNYWVDATAALQGGGLARLHHSDFERALPLDDEGAEIAALTPELQSEDVEDDFVVAFPQSSAPTTLESRRRYRAERADQVRRLFHLASADEISKYFTSVYERDFSGARLVGSVAHTDDRGANLVDVVARFELGNLWYWSSEDADYHAIWIARRFERFLPELGANRSAPLALPFPLRLHAAVRVTLPYDVADAETESRTEGPGFELEFHQRYRRGTISSTFDSKTLAPSLSAPDFERFRKAVDSAAGLEWGTVWLVPDGFNLWGLIAVIALGLLLGCGGWFVYRMELGEAPGAGEPPPVGRKIRGWAVVLFVFLVLTAISWARTLATGIRAATSRWSWHQWIAGSKEHATGWGVGLAVFELAASVLGLVAMLVLLVSFLRKRRSLRWQLTGALAGMIVLRGIDAAWTYLLYPGIHRNPLLALFGWLLTACWMAPWIVYAWRSRRFRETFIRSARRAAPSSPPPATSDEGRPDTMTESASPS
jgi:transglutaminase-like putative cysteine protease